jgi:hypothetical protein
MIHDVDQLLEKLVRRDALNGSGVDLVFDAPTKDWVARRSGPAVDLYLYDIREDLQRRVPAWEDIRGKTGEVSDRRQPPRRFRLAYLVTAWTQRPEDEHRLLSALLGCFLRNPMLKPGELGGSLDDADLPVYIEASRPARALAGRIWSPRAASSSSLDVVVIAPIVVSTSALWPPVRTGPTIGRSASGGAGEQAAGRRGRRPDLPPLEPLPEETVPRGAAASGPGHKLRVPGHPP